MGYATENKVHQQAASLAVAILLLFLLNGGVAYNMRPDLSGVWIPDASRSTYHRKTKAAPATQTSPAATMAVYRSERIDQKGGSITISTLDDAGKSIRTVVLSADGIEAVNEIGGVKHRSITLWQGNKLVTDWAEERAGEVITRGKDTRELSEDETTLTLRKHAEDSSSAEDWSIVFTKKTGSQ